MRQADLQAALRPLNNRIRAIANRTSITRVADAGLSQQVQVTVLAGERLSDVVRLQNFGLTANPPAGSTALLISMGGSRTHCVVIGADHESRPRDLQPGESQLYNQWGDCVYLQENGETLVKGRSKVISDSPLTHVLGNAEIDGDLLVHGNATFNGNVEMDQELMVAGDVELQADLQVTGAAHVDGAITSDTSVADPAGTMAEMRVIYNGHTHDGLGGSVSNPPLQQMDGDGSGGGGGGGDDPGDGDPGGPGGGGGGGGGPTP